MPEKPLISKIRVHNPNKKGSKNSNRNYLIYIATREGVDLSEYNDLNMTAPDEMSDNPTYLNYINERPKSHGLFGNINVNDIDSLSKDIYTMSKNNKTIFRGITSLSENDAIKLEYDNKYKWVELMNRSMPKVAKQFDIPIDKLSWVAAVHMEKKHPHVHYMFWRNDDKIQNPYIHVSKQNKCREIFSGIVFEEEREKAVIEKTIKRDLLIDLGKDLSNTIIQEIDNNKIVEAKIPDNLTYNEINNYINELILLSKMLPGSGRITYKLVNEEVKNKIDHITEMFLTRKDFKLAYNEYINYSKNIAETYSASKFKIDFSVKKADEDIKKRIGNIILKSAKELAKIEKQLNYKKIAEKNKNAYRVHVTYSLFKNVFFSLFRNKESQKHNYNSLKANRSRSKQALKEAAKKQSLKGAEFDD